MIRSLLGVGAVNVCGSKSGPHDGQLEKNSIDELVLHNMKTKHATRHSNTSSARTKCKEKNS